MHSHRITDHAYPGDAVMAVLIAVVSLLMVSEIKMFSLKFANLSLRENVRRYVIMAATVLFVITDGVSGFASDNCALHSDLASWQAHRS